MQTKVNFMKQLVILILLIIGFQYANAQRSFQLGMTASPTLGWIKPDADGIDHEKNRLGFNYGLIGDFNIADNYSISTGILIVNTGGSVSFPALQSVGGTTEYGRVQADIQLKYIEIPLTFKLKTNQIGYITYYGQFGFGASINYDAEADLEFRYPSAGSSINTNNTDFASEISLFKASMIIGVGAEYNLSGNTSILIGLTFDNGFTNIYNLDVPKSDSNGNAVNTGEKRAVKGINNYLALNLGVLF